MTEESTEALNANFDATDWTVFVKVTECIDELGDTIADYIKLNIDILLHQKTIKQYPNNKPWINNELRNKVVVKHKTHTYEADDRNIRQLEVNEGINKAKLEHSDKVEHLFNTKKMKKAWTGLKILAD